MATYIYAILGRDGEIRYIGQSRDAKWRWRMHWNDRNRRSSKLHLWLRTLDERPDAKVVAIVEDEQANPVERGCIIALRKLTNGRLLNEKIKGAIRAETRAKLSAAARGRTVSAETRAKIGAANRGRPKTPELLEVMRANTSARWVDPEKAARILAGQRSPEGRANRAAAQRGKEMPMETRYKIGAKNRGRTHTPEARLRISEAAKAMWERRRLPPE